MTNIITKLIGDKRGYRAYLARKDRLDQPYRDVMEAVQRYIFHFPPTEAEQLQALLDDVVELLEQAAAQRTPIREVVGADPVEFVDAFIRNYPEPGWVAKERSRLTEAVAQAERGEALR